MNHSASLPPAASSRMKSQKEEDAMPFLKDLLHNLKGELNESAKELSEEEIQKNLENSDSFDDSDIDDDLLDD
jgi:hypothetical protein